MKKIILILLVCILMGISSILLLGSDIVSATPQPVIKHFSVYMNGKISRFTSSQTTVKEALREQNIIYNKKLMFPREEETLLDGTQIFLLKRNEKFYFKEFSISDIPVEYKDDPTIEYGKETTLKPGLPGIDKVIFKISADGQQTEIGRIHKINPRTALVLRGTKDCVMTEQGLKHYKKKFIANVTAYTIEDGNGDGVTSIGIVPYEGVVAVDPTFIPYHSKLFIPGYGLAVAADTGGAINDNCIDLFMYDRDRAWQWGRRHIEVYLLDD